MRSRGWRPTSWPRWRSWSTGRRSWRPSAPPSSPSCTRRRGAARAALSRVPAARRGARGCFCWVFLGRRALLAGERRGAGAALRAAPRACGAGR